MADRRTEAVAGIAQNTNSDRTLDHLVVWRYDELISKARRLLRGERTDHTLQTCALIHEAYLRMRDLCHVDWQDRARFIPVAVGIMRRVLVDHARRSNAQKRGGLAQLVQLNDEVFEGTTSIDVLDLDRALERLDDRDPVQVKIVEHRFFGGLTIEQTSKALDLSPATVKRKWTLAQAWLYREMKGNLDSVEN